MKKTILVAGKDMPECSAFCESLSKSGRKVAAGGKETEADEAKKTIAERRTQMEAYNESKTVEAKSGICTFEWNKSSPLSTRSFILQTENAFQSLDEAVLYFDEEYFASNAQKMDAEEVSRCCDEMLLSFQNLALEILNRFEKKYTENPFTLIFMLKECPCVSDAARLPSLRNGSVAIASPLVAAAASAFSSFAENIAAMYGDSVFTNILLVRGECKSDKSLTQGQEAQWLSSYLDGLYAQKTKLSAKKSMQWISIGAKFSSSPFDSIKNKFLKKI